MCKSTMSKYRRNGNYLFIKLCKHLFKKIVIQFKGKIRYTSQVYTTFYSRFTLVV